MDGHVFQPPYPPSYSADGTGLAHGSTLRAKGAMVVCGREDAPRAVLWIHGNASDCGLESNACVCLAQSLDAFVMQPEWPGYGLVPGPPSERGVDEAVLAGWKMLSATHSNKQIIICGRSLGTGAAARLARNLHASEGTPPAALVLWSVISSVRGVVKSLLPAPLAWGAFFVDKRWDVAADIAFCSSPTLFIGGGQDTLTPLSMLQEVRGASGAALVLEHISPNATHNGGWVLMEDVIAPIRALCGMEEENAILENLESFGSNIVARDSKDTPVVAKPVFGLVSDFSHQILIVGAGPVGLFLAASVAELDPFAKILLVEKHASYKRHHVLRLERSSIQHATPRLRSVVAPLVGVTRTSALEAALLAHCASLGEDRVRLFRGVTVDSEDNPLFRQARIIVGCDGSHSFVREKLLLGEGERESLQYVVDVRMLVAGSPPLKMTLLQQLSALQYTSHIVEESMGRIANDEGLYPSTIRLLISATEHQVLRSAGATLRAPLQLPDNYELLPLSLAASIRSWLAIRQSHWPEERHQNITCTSIDLSVYRARAFASRKHNQTVFIAGDAAFGVPFFRSLNNGLLCAAQLASALLDELRCAADPMTPSFDTKQSSSSSFSSHSSSSAPSEPESWLGSLVSGISASTGLSRNLSEVSARGATMGVLQLLPDEPDPVLRYSSFVHHLAQREFSSARAKRDGLAIVQLSNRFRMKHGYRE